MQISLTGSVKVLALLPLLLLGACAGSSSHMRDVPETQASYETRGDQALVVFMRPSTLGAALQSSVFQIVEGEPELIGILSAKTKLAHYAGPGPHRFMVIGESADFMDATLHAGKAYYALVTPRFGVWKQRYSLRPLRKAGQQDADFASWYRDTRWVENGPSASEWASANASSIRGKMNEDLPDWLKKENKPVLFAGDGADTLYRAPE